VRRRGGFSLVELMVAITLSLIVTVALISVFVGSRSAYRATSGVAALTDGGRFALSFIQQSARNAGFMACNHATAATQLTILNVAATPEMQYDYAHALGGFEANGSGPTNTLTVRLPPVLVDAAAADWTPNLDSKINNVNLAVAGSDVLVLRSGLPQTQPVYVTNIADGALNFIVNANTANQLQPGQTAVISDCTKSMTFQVLGAGVGAGATIDHSAGGVAPGNGSGGVFPISFAAGSVVSPVTTRVYFIGKGLDGDGALFSIDQNGTGVFGPAQELVPDIENMQVLYGVDTSGTQTQFKYVTADQVADFDTVMYVRVAVLAASPPSSVPLPAAAPTFTLLGTTVRAPIDTRMRKVFEMTIALRNAVN
jgi:type IV pilus assembly protein PilW